MIIKHRGFKPKYESSVFIAPTAVVIGKVSIGKVSRVMYGSILDSEGSRVEIGECSIICEKDYFIHVLAGRYSHMPLTGEMVITLVMVITVEHTENDIKYYY